MAGMYVALARSPAAVAPRPASQRAPATPPDFATGRASDGFFFVAMRAPRNNSDHHFPTQP